MSRVTRYAALGAAAALITGCLHVYEPRPSTGTPASASTATPATPAKPDDKGPFKPWEEILKDTKPIDGYLKLHSKRDNTLFIELSAAQLEKDLGLVMHISKGVGVFNIQ